MAASTSYIAFFLYFFLSPKKLTCYCCQSAVQWDGFLSFHVYLYCFNQLSYHDFYTIQKNINFIHTNQCSRTYIGPTSTQTQFWTTFEVVPCYLQLTLKFNLINCLKPNGNNYLNKHCICIVI